MLSKTAVTEAIRRHGKAPLIYLGTALVLTGAGTATAAASAAPPAATTPAAIGHPVTAPAAIGHPVTAPAAISGYAATVQHAPAGRPGVQAGTKGRRQQAGARAAGAAPVRKPAAADYKAGALPLADRLLTGPVSGPQERMPITPARRQNAAAIVRQALDMHLGIRTAVIAVATSMQEATLDNIDYGTADSLGLFQQRPSCGWGTPAQIMNPAHAAGAFLTALHAHQETDPSWASQPLWASAQAVQGSAYPTVYAKWEAQAASLVQDITGHPG